METKPDSGRKAQADAQAAGIATGHIILGLVLSLLSVGVFALVWEQVEDKSHLATGFDRAVLFWLWHHQVPWITTVAKGLAWMGSPPVIVSMAAIGAVLGLFWRRVRGAAWTLPLAVLGAGVIIQGIKMEFRRPRPTFFSPLLHESGYSFPSGHSLIAIVVYGLLGYFALHLVKGHAARLAVRVITVLLVIAIGVSRPYVQVHYPTDVLAGWTAGFPWLLTCIWLHEVLSRHFRKAGEPILPDVPKSPIAQAVTGKDT
ncbi:MAG: phosphatase PAP2 family protein [Armatimonadetes bacterium]|nr:phosphatase PAP2 family protein [Armatimonadota bacterium]